MNGWHLERRISPKSRDDSVGRCRDGVERRITKLDSDLIGLLSNKVTFPLLDT